jgi:menaquinone-dependent protoporphyrinogen oxidase
MASPRILVVYATPGSEGQTALIARRLATTLRAAGAVAEVVDLGAADAPPLERYDGALIGGSVRGGRYRRSLRRLLAARGDELGRMPWAFFSVCLTIAAVSEEAREEARALPRRLLADEGLEPAEVAVFGGALRFSRHSRLGARILFRVNRRDLPEAGMDHDWEYTDWDEVDALARRMLAAIVASMRPVAS